MTKAYVLEGPAGAGNVFGYYKPDLIPAGKCAIVTRGPFANGGYGPSTADGRLYSSPAEARAALAERNGPQWCSECGEFFPHIVSNNCCANCRNAALREATPQLD